MAGWIRVPEAKRWLGAGVLALGALASAGSGSRPVGAFDQVFSCVSKPSELRELGFSARGTISEVLVKAGDRVKTGQRIVNLDDRVQAQTVELAKLAADDTSQVRMAETTLAYRDEELKLVSATYDKVATAPSELREARYRHENAKIELESAQVKSRSDAVSYLREQARLAEMRITSPIDAVVLDVHKRAGETVDQGTAVVTLVSIDPLWLEVNVDTRVAVELNVGQAAVVEWEDVDGVEPMPGTLIFKSPAANAGARKVQMRVEVPNARAIPGGLHGKVRFVKGAEGSAGR